MLAHEEDAAIVRRPLDRKAMNARDAVDDQQEPLLEPLEVELQRLLARGGREELFADDDLLAVCFAGQVGPAFASLIGEDPLDPQARGQQAGLAVGAGESNDL